MAEPITVVLVDDHEVVRRGVRDLLDADPAISVIGEASSYAEAMARVPALRPVVAVLDVRLPDGSGVELCRELRAAMPDLRVLILTSFSDDEALFDAIMAGAAGYVLKQIRGADLLHAVQAVGAGQSLLDPALTSKVLERLRHPQTEDPRLSSLTDQERRILDLIAEGLTNREIGERMYLAEKTVRNYVSSVLGKLGMARRTQAAVYAASLAERKGLRAGEEPRN